MCDVKTRKRYTTEDVLSAYAGHPLSQASILDRLRRNLPANIRPTEFDLAIDPGREITDQNHVGGALSTLQLAALAGVNARHCILDLGCGLGGPARLLALVFRCRVYGIDANRQRVTDAIALTELVDLSASVRFRCTDVATLAPEPKFDIVWVQNAWLHIGEPALLASTAARAVVPRGRLAFEEVFLKRSPRSSQEQSLLGELCEAWRCSLLPLVEWIKAFQSFGFAINASEDANALFLDYFLRTVESDKQSRWPEHELLGHRNALALGKAGVVSYGRVIATMGAG